MTGSRKALATLCLALVLLAAIAIAPAYALLGWILVAAALFLDALRPAGFVPSHIPLAAPRHRTHARLAPRAPPLAA